MIDINAEKVRKTIDNDEFKEGVAKYRYIMNNLHQCDVSENIEFQCIFNDFYGMNMVQKKKFPTFHKTYYSLMEQNKKLQNVDFVGIVKHLHDETGMVAPSFSSKMLHTIKKDMPIWDRHVLRNLDKKAPAYNKDREKNIQQHNTLYHEICEWHSKCLNDKKCKEVLGLFGKEYADISDTKKIDFILWLTRDE